MLCRYKDMLNSISVRNRLIILAAVPLIALVFTTLFSLKIMSGLVNGIDSLYEDRVIPLKQIKSVSDGYAVQIVDSFHKYRAAQITVEDLKGQIDDALTNAEKVWGQYKQTKLTSEEARLVDISDRLMKKANTEIQAMKLQLGNGQLKQMSNDEFVPKLYGFMDPFSGSLEALINLQLDESGRFRNEADTKAKETRILLMVTMAVMIGVLIVGATLIYRSIFRPLRSLQRTVSHIASEADLRKDSEVVGSDEIAETASSVNDMLCAFRTILKEVNGASMTLGSAAEEMQVISNQVANTASDQQQQTEMIATAVTQMSAAIQEVANNAELTAGKATDSDAAAKAGIGKIAANIDSIQTLNKVIDESTQVIVNLSEQANEINSVVQMIQGVAEQTNLLALNAAIEAARAGDSGRGFAVVADEVRQLAHNTQQATERISDMILRLQQASKTAVGSMEKAQQCASTSVKHSEESQSAIEEISYSITTIADMNIQVSTATEEQTTVAADISRNINEFNSSIKTVSESSRQNAIASQELATLASTLQSKVAKFKL